RKELMTFSDLLAAEYDYQALDLPRIPYGDFALDFARSGGNNSVLHSYGAIQCLERLLNFVSDQGFILINDYGWTLGHDADEFQHQRYSRATFVGVNFPLLEAYFGSRVSNAWVKAKEEDASVHARLLGQEPASETIACFHERFSSDALRKLQEPVDLARSAAKSGRFEAALAAYQRALELQPYNWLLMNEVAHFLAFPLRSPAAGLAMARAGLS